MIKNLVLISDTHCGSKLGLCPPKIALDEGGKYEASPLQQVVWKMWQEYWKWVSKELAGAPFVIVHCGDAIDGSHHNTDSVITNNEKDQISIAEQAFRLPLSMPNLKGWYHIRGTEAHVGGSGRWEEALARNLGAVPDSSGNHARWDLWLELGAKKSLIQFSHHIGVSSTTAAQGGAMQRELVESFIEAGRWGNRPPDALVRGHRHEHYEGSIATKNNKALGITLPGWQLKTPFCYRLTKGRVSTPQMGGVILKEGHEVPLYTLNKIWTVDRSELVAL